MRWWAMCAAVSLLLAGCSSAGHVSAPGPTAAATTASTAGSTATSRPGGLIGVIDTARVAAVCADARQAETLVEGGDAGAATESLAAAATLLERPPVDPSATATAVTIRAEVRAGHANAGVAAALAFCRSHGG